MRGLIFSINRMYKLFSNILRSNAPEDTLNQFSFNFFYTNFFYVSRTQASKSYS